MINVDDRIFKTGLAAKMKPTGVSVYFAIATHQNNKNAAWPGIDRICELTGIKKDAAYSAIKNLIDLGLIDRTQTKQKDSKKFGKTIYSLKCEYVKTYTENTQKPLTEKPCTEKPETSEPCREKPCTEKPDNEVLTNIEVLTNKKKEKKKKEKQPQNGHAKRIDDFLNQLKEDQIWYEGFAYLFKVKGDTPIQIATLFAIEQKTTDRLYHSIRDFKQHLQNWTRSRGVDSILRELRIVKSRQSRETQLKPVAINQTSREELLKVALNARAKYK